MKLTRSMIKPRLSLLSIIILHLSKFRSLFLTDKPPFHSDSVISNSFPAEIANLFDIVSSTLLFKIPLDFTLPFLDSDPSYWLHICEF
jgi:hypothetical protein